MPEQNGTPKTRRRLIRHKGRGSQVLIYLGKQLRFFINENDWKVLPMAAVIAGLVGMVIRKEFFLNMEGSLFGSFALTCVAIWNGCFNSIQAVCRERAIIKREHRSGMHVSSYVAAHMIYQFLLCAAQTGLTMYVLQMLGVQFPEKGLMTGYMIIDMGITMLLISYASDMMSLFLSSISHTTTGAMTLMPFVLIFQLVFSGGIIPLPEWSRSISDYTVSNYGLRAIAAQSGYNELPMEKVWSIVAAMRNDEIGGTVTVGEILDKLDSPVLEKRRDMEVLKSYTVGEAAEILNAADESLHLRDQEITVSMTAREILELIQTGDVFEALRNRAVQSGSDVAAVDAAEKVLDAILASEELQPMLDQEVTTGYTLGQVLDSLHAEEKVKAVEDRKLNDPVTLGDVVDFLKNNSAIREQRDRTITVKTTMGELFDLFGEENIRDIIQRKTAAAGKNPAYENSRRNIIDNWVMLGIFVVVFALLSTVVLELIDRDKR